MRWAAVTHDRTIVCMRARRLAANEGSLHVEDNGDLKSTSRVREPWGVARRGGTLERCKESTSGLHGAADPVVLVRV